LLGVIQTTTKKEENKPALDEKTDIVKNPRIRRNEKIERTPATPPTSQSNPMNPTTQVQDLLWTLFNYYVAYLVFSILFSGKLPFPPNM